MSVSLHDFIIMTFKSYELFSCEDLVDIRWEKFPDATTFYDDMVMSQVLITNWQVFKKHFLVQF